MALIHDAKGPPEEGTRPQNMVGVNFKTNPSLRERYGEYLDSSPMTSSPLLLSTPCCLVAKVASSTSSLAALAALSTRIGFSRCSGRLFSMTHISSSLTTFLTAMEDALPSNTTVRTHAHPASLSSTILDYIDQSTGLKARGVASSPTQFCTLLVAVQLEGGVGWGVYTLDQYRATIARPGDGDPLPEFTLNFNRAEYKLAEACQLLTQGERQLVFPRARSLLLAVDVGAAPGGWTGYLAALDHTDTSVVAIDPASLEEAVLARSNVCHLRHKVGWWGGALLLVPAIVKAVSTKKYGFFNGSKFISLFLRDFFFVLFP